jgi:hypothetical protein
MSRQFIMFCFRPAKAWFPDEIWSDARGGEC